LKFIKYTHHQMHNLNNIMKFKIHIKTFKMLLHVSILRSSSGTIHCSLLKLYIKTISELLLYNNNVCSLRMTSGSKHVGAF
jgi:hypothetical protein